MPVEQRLVCLFVVAVLLASHCVQGASNSAKEGDKATSGQVTLERIAESGVGARIAQDASSKTQSSKHSFSVAQKRVNNPETTCEAANEWMKREYPDWKEQASNFDAHTLPKCLRQWASAILPEGMREYPVLTCNAPDGWENACSSAGGMGINVVAVATFPGNSSRQLTFPACVSGAKPCIASRTSADFMWVGLVNKIQTWCNNQSMSAFRCEGVKISSNFWTVANIPKVIKIVVGVLVAVAIVVAVIILVVYCRWKRKKEHEDALERTMLLRLARRVSNRPPGTYTDPDDMSLMTLGSNASSRSTSLSSSTSSAPGLTPSFSSIQGTRVSAASLPPMNP